MLLLPSFPGWFTAFHLMVAGITLYTGITTLIYLCYGQQPRQNAYFFVMCIVATADLLVKVGYDVAASTERAIDLLHWRYALILVFLPALFGYVSAYTGQKRFRTWFLLLIAICAGLMVVNFWITPYSLRFSSMELGGTTTMPWGENMERFVGTPSIWNVLTRILITVVVLWAIVRTRILARSGKRRAAQFLAAALILMLITVWLSILADYGYITSIFLMPSSLSFIGLVLFMSAARALEMRDNNRALKTTAENLQQEIALHRQAEERIRHMAYHDHLTDLPNRLKLQELLAETAIRCNQTGRKAALILLDLVDFKVINDVLGHDTGDRLLQRVGERLFTLCQEGETLAHLGGDEFVVLLPEIKGDANEVAAVARRITERNFDALSRPFILNGHSLEISTCAGIALFPEEHESEAGLLQRVDMALERAKSFGHGTIQIYAEDMRTEMHERLQLERDMRKGMEQGDFMMYYQPQVDLAGNIVGTEALLRWRHPERGYISPAIFVPLAERSGLITQLGDWALEKACQQIKTWKTSLPFFEGNLSVNVSAWQFMQRNFKEDVCRHLDDAGIDAGRLTVEITESAFLHDIELAISTIKFLRSYGVRFSIDDFGTGYASLSYLRRLPVDELKIDKAFIKNLGADLRDTHLVETIIRIAKHMGMQVVAEGVENESQKSVLAAIDCWALQGYYFAPPMDENAFSRWVRGRHENKPVHVAR